MYLGDGWVGPPSRPNRLCFTLDEAYPEIISETIVAIQLAAFFNPVTTRHHRNDAGIVVTCCANHWGDAFPQYGPGRKHSRPIVLADWQRAVADRYPEQFVRGLIHSDGCRTVNRFKTRLPSGRVAEYEYPRYFFSNCRPTSATCSASTASDWACGGRAPTTATSACRTVTASRSSMRSSDRSADRAGAPRGCGRGRRCGEAGDQEHARQDHDAAEHRGKVDRLAEEERCPEHAEHGHDEDHRHPAGRPELAEEPEVQEIRHAGGGERQREEAGDVDRVRSRAEWYRRNQRQEHRRGPELLADGKGQRWLVRKPDPHEVGADPVRERGGKTREDRQHERQIDGERRQADHQRHARDAEHEARLGRVRHPVPEPHGADDGAAKRRHRVEHGRERRLDLELRRGEQRERQRRVDRAEDEV